MKTAMTKTIWNGTVSGTKTQGANRLMAHFTGPICHWDIQAFIDKYLTATVVAPCRHYAGVTSEDGNLAVEFQGTKERREKGTL